MGIRTYFNKVAYGQNQPGYVLPQPTIVANRSPGTDDLTEVGTTWLNSVTQQYYFLGAITAGIANWVLLAASTGALDSLTGDTGTAIPVAGNIKIAGGGGASNIVTSATGSTVSIAVSSSPSFLGTTTVATGLIATTGNIVATAGNINATAGSMSAGTTITAGTGITSTTGNITASTGNIVATLGSISANTTVTAGTVVTAGTGVTVTAFGAGVIIASTAGVFSSIPGTAGQVLTSNGVGVAPTFQTAGSTTGYTATSTSPYVVLTTDDFIGVTAAGAFTVELPNAPATGRIFTIKDAGGTAGTDNITVTTVGGIVLIDGAATNVINTNFQSIQVLFNGTKYLVF
jgi:hypothetical protein